MADREWSRLMAREKEIDQWLRAASNAVTEPGAVQIRRLEKTIIMATAAIVEAIWNARA
jgi:hypothetical protein